MLGSALGFALEIRVAEVGFSTSAESGSARNYGRMWIQTWALTSWLTRGRDAVRARNRAHMEWRTDAKSGMGVDPEAHADSAVKYDSEAGEVARSELGSESELRKADAV